MSSRIYFQLSWCGAVAVFTVHMGSSSSHPHGAPTIQEIYERIRSTHTRPHFNSCMNVETSAATGVLLWICSHLFLIWKTYSKDTPTRDDRIVNKHLTWWYKQWGNNGTANSAAAVYSVWHVSNSRPVGQMWPAKPLHVAHTVSHIFIKKILFYSVKTDFSTGTIIGEQRGQIRRHALKMVLWFAGYTAYIGLLLTPLVN